MCYYSMCSVVSIAIVFKCRQMIWPHHVSLLAIIGINCTFSLILQHICISFELSVNQFYSRRAILLIKAFDPKVNFELWYGTSMNVKSAHLKATVRNMNPGTPLTPHTLCVDNVFFTDNETWYSLLGCVRGQRFHVKSRHSRCCHLVQQPLEPQYC